VAEQVKRLTVDGSVVLSVAVLERTLIDIEGQGVTGSVSRNRSALVRRAETWQDYLDAVVWIASTKATLWFDVLGWSQVDCLRSIRWREHAESLMSNNRANLTANQIQILEQGIAVFLELDSMS